MVEFGTGLVVLTAAALAAFGAVLLVAGGRRTDVGFLVAAFVLAAADVVASALPRGTASAWIRAAWAAGVLAPAALYYFFSLWPERNALNAPGRVAAVVAPGAALAIAAAVVEPGTAASFLRGGLGSVYAAAVAAFVLHDLLRRIGRAPGDPRLRLLFPALWFVTLPVLGRAARQLVVATTGLTGRQLFDPAAVAVASAAHVAVVLLVTALVLRLARGLPGPRRTLALAAYAGLALSLAFRVPELPFLLAAPAVAPATSPFAEILAAENAVRWLAFAGLVSVAVLRHGMLGLASRERRAAARVAIACTAAFAVLAAVAALGAAGLAVRAPGLVEGVVLGGVLLLSQGVRSLVDGVAERVYGVPRPGAVPESAPLVPGARILRRYRVERLLGRGGGGRTFLARDEVLGRDVAVKEVLHEGDEAAALREARAAAAVRHANVVAVHDVVAVPGATLLVAEYVAGGSLAERLARGDDLPPAEAARLVEGVLAGLGAIHAVGLAHGDLSPANVLLDASGPKLADFGLARGPRGATARDPAEVYGATPGWASPETLRGDGPTPASDVYAAGLLARRLFAGLSGGRAAVVERALAREPTDRFPDARAMLAAWGQADQ